MTSVSIHEAKTKLSALISEIERSGESISISRYGKVVARLVPVKPKDRLLLSKGLSNIEVGCDLTEETGGEWNDV